MNPTPFDESSSSLNLPSLSESTLSGGRQPIGDLVERIKRSADQLAENGSSRGDLKLLSRTIRELSYAFKVFSPYRRHRKVTVFGSARTSPAAPAYQQAVEFGRAIAQRNWLVVTGAAAGIMEAGHVGAGREKSMGLNIMLPFEQAANPVIAGDEKLVNMKYFFTRKIMFVKECDAVCCLPGGFGTMDEATEVITLLQTGKRDLVPLVLLDAPGGSFWKSFDEFIVQHMLGNGLISNEDLCLYRLTDNVETAVDEIMNFYRNYHSMRYVRDYLVLRLQEAPGAELMSELQGYFGSIAVDGRIELSGPLDDEQNEPNLASLPRLVLKFNRRNLGLLRLMIDCLNANSLDPISRSRLP